MRYGIYGGAFDPLHWGHLLLAETCLRQAKLERIIFVPTGMSPHRRDKHSYDAPAEDRSAMLQEAVAGYEEFVVSDFEVNRKQTSYTVETLRHFSETLESPELFLLVGADMFSDLPNWYKADEICRLVIPLAVCRPGYPQPDYTMLKPLISEKRERQIAAQPLIQMPLIGLSSTAIRKNIAEGKSIRFQVPECVEKYIVEHDLYRKPASEL
ncbi:MAG: nicotinate-nucleotide adenylyltransferase [Planctomycetaceae bacterium]|nr:nicotinate-nucleotide adenylyltransferase [Planctomycetaceae bacterium]